VRRGRLGFWLRFAVVVLKPLLTLLTRRDWQQRDRVPATGGLVLVTNHVSHADPLTFAHFVYDCGRLPRFLAKSELFGVPFVGRLLRGAGQIAVYRDSARASEAYRDAVAAVRDGQCVIVYPESTITRDPGLWPMTGKTGAARIALETGAPVVPVAQWGPQEILPPYATRPRLGARRVVHVRAGAPVDLTDVADHPLTSEVLHVATERIMDAVTRELEVLRGEDAPPRRHDPRAADRPEPGERRSREEPGERRSRDEPGDERSTA
jgi:1-acyl-sn-glycerol-3-phosphate acyltransferase